MAPNSRKAAQNVFPNASPDVNNAVENVLSSFNPRENARDPSAIFRHLAGQDSLTIEALLSAIGTVNNPDITNFNFSSVPVKTESFWVLQLMPMGFQGQNGHFSEDYFDGGLPVFQIMIYDERSAHRVAEPTPEPGLPASNFLLTCIKKAIAAPMYPFRPALPGLFIIAHKLSPHVSALRPFLDSLPQPFSWRLETPEEAEEVAEGVHQKNRIGIAKGLQQAESEKALGNQAVARKNRDNAVKHYGEAIECLYNAWSQKPTEAETRKIKNLMSICLSNRAAAWLMEGVKRDPQKALKDAEEAIDRDPSYGKAYYRAAKAHQLLAQNDKAIEVLISALRNPELASDKGLNDALIETYGGLPNTDEELRAFCATNFKESTSDYRA
ncbi:unnamed protein product [Somion occarium]|uniref:Uncharacterized protein n=1 Tax=Somion occarium TaxID=3059160 RepID=A0ABP1DP19_9APHY